MSQGRLVAMVMFIIMTVLTAGRTAWSNLNEDVQNAIFGLLTSVVLASTLAFVSKACRDKAMVTLQGRLQNEKETVIAAAVGSSADNITFFLFVLKMICLLRTNGNERGGRITVDNRYFLLDATYDATSYLREVSTDQMETHLANRGSSLIIGCRNTPCMTRFCTRFSQEEAVKFREYCRALTKRVHTGFDNRPIYFV